MELIYKRYHQGEISFGRVVQELGITSWELSDLIEKKGGFRIICQSLRRMDFDTQVKLAIYRFFVEMGERPSPEAIAERMGVETAVILDTYQQLAAKRMLVLEPDGVSIRMAPPFSGVETQHLVKLADKEYYANCAWDALGIVAAMQSPGTVHSRCEQTGERLRLEIGSDGPAPSSWLFHCLVPAAKWWDDIVFT